MHFRVTWVSTIVLRLLPMISENRKDSDLVQKHKSLVRICIVLIPTVRKQHFLPE